MIADMFLIGRLTKKYAGYLLLQMTFQFCNFWTNVTCLSDYR